ncbi:MAG: alpha-2-macroglobulin family protein [Hyphomicrobiaceae bacterium]
MVRSILVAFTVLLGTFLPVALPVAVTPAEAAEVFRHKGLDGDAKRFEAWLKANWKPGKRKARRFLLAGDKLLAGNKDPRGASRQYASAVVASPKSEQAWYGLSKSLLSIPLKELSGSERYRAPVNASAAAYRAYQAGRTDKSRARSLVLLSQALQRRSYWRPAIETLRIALSLEDEKTTRTSYEALLATHGFRVTNYRINNEMARPELCIEFSEDLKRGDVDFAKFVSVNGRGPETVRAKKRELCLNGFKHGDNYEVLVRGGLPSQVGETLAKNAELAIYVRDRSPTVRFTGRSYVLPSRGQNGIPVVSINTDELGVEIFRIGDRSLVRTIAEGDITRQLNRWDLKELRNKKGTSVYRGSLKVRRALNKEVTTALPVGEAIPKLEPGVYSVVAWADKKSLQTGGELATQWFIVSDLGLTAYSGGDGVHAFVRSLATASPSQGATVKLVARNNEVLATGKTNAGGYVRFDAGLSKGEGSLRPALLVAQGADGDYAFLDMASGAFDLSDRGVKGRAYPGAVDGYLYLDRGVYRPGEQVKLSAIVRTAKARASNVPVTVIVLRPDGVEHRRIRLAAGDLGGHTTTLALASGAMTGTWRLTLHTDPKADPIAREAFLVEDFVPERLALKLEAVTGHISPAQAGKVNLAGKYLYGPPASDLAIDGEVVVSAATGGLKNFPGYHFGLADEIVTSTRGEIANAPRTSKDGTAVVDVALPKIPRTARPLVAKVVLRLKESGGRAIERTVSMPVHGEQPRLGIKPLFEDNIGEGETARFELIAIDAANQQIAMPGLRWELVRLERSWQWYKRDGRWAYEAMTYPRKVANGKFDAAADAPIKIAQQLDWGRYRLDVQRVDGQPMASSYYFNAGWYATDDVDSPEMLAVALDKPSYKAGETAKLKISTRTPGKAMIAILSNGLVSARDIHVSAGDSEIDIPVGQDWGAGAYVIATLYRSLDKASKRMPGRALGVAWLGLDQAQRTLKVGLDAPDKVRSGSKLTVPIQIDGLAGAKGARVTVAAVDVGVLNLTRFVSPAPTKWFFAQPLLGTEIRDLYGRLIDGMKAERGALKSGGDADGSTGMHGSPPVEETVALFSGIVQVGDDGRAEVSFDMPDFNGAVRLMAVAWSEDKIGESSQSVIVRDKVAITASVPRFLTLGDRAVLQLDLHNIELPETKLSVRVARTYSTGAPTEVLRREVALAKDGKDALRLEVEPKELGLVTYDVFVTGPDGLNVERDYILDVKPPASAVRRSVARAIPAGGNIKLGRELLKNLIPGEARMSLSVGPGAALDVPAMLTQLDRYPYGCAEQTISRALPLLYSNDLSVGVGMTADAALKARIEKSLTRVFAMQDSSGAFGVWSPSNPDMWLTAYVTDFLTRAREKGFTVDRRGFGQALARLQNYVSYVSDFKKGGEKRAYALYVLARNGRAPIGELRYYADARLSRFGTPIAKAQLGAALAMAGDKARAERAFNAAIDDLDDLSRQTARADFGSTLRDAAAVLTLASETSSVPSRTAALTQKLSAAYSERTHTSTQEQAWLLLAARGLDQQTKDLKLTINGKAYEGTARANLSTAALTTDGMVLGNAGTSATDAVVTVIGSSLKPEPAVANGLTVERKYFTLEGREIDLATEAANLGQTDRLAVVLTISSKEAGGRLLLVDRLPAGLEIENPRLVESGDVKALSWLKSHWSPDHTEFRDDRFVAAFDFFRAGTKVRSATVAYIVRAVTPGNFVHPAATVEDMYRPERHARTTGGRLIIKAQ